MDYIQRTIDLALANVEQGGRPFACIIVKGGESSPRRSTGRPDTQPDGACGDRGHPQASAKLGSETFTGCEFYIMAHPCPMCLAAMYYCSPERVVFITAREDYRRVLHRRPEIFHARQFLRGNRQAAGTNPQECRWSMSLGPARSNVYRGDGKRSTGLDSRSTSAATQAIEQDPGGDGHIERARPARHRDRDRPVGPGPSQSASTPSSSLPRIKAQRSGTGKASKASASGSATAASSSRFQVERQTIGDTEPGPA